MIITSVIIESGVRVDNNSLRNERRRPYPCEGFLALWRESADGIDVYAVDLVSFVRH